MIELLLSSRYIQVPVKIHPADPKHLFINSASSSFVFIFGDPCSIFFIELHGKYDRVDDLYDYEF